MTIPDFKGGEDQPVLRQWIETLKSEGLTPYGLSEAIKDLHPRNIRISHTAIQEFLKSDKQRLGDTVPKLGKIWDYLRLNEKYAKHFPKKGVPVKTEHHLASNLFTTFAEFFHQTNNKFYDDLRKRLPGQYAMYTIFRESITHDDDEPDEDGDLEDDALFDEHRERNKLRLRISLLEITEMEHGLELREIQNPSAQKSSLLYRYRNHGWLSKDEQMIAEEINAAKIAADFFREFSEPYDDVINGALLPCEQRLIGLLRCQAPLLFKCMTVEEFKPSSGEVMEMLGTMMIFPAYTGQFVCMRLRSGYDFHDTVIQDRMFDIKMKKYMKSG